MNNYSTAQEYAKAATESSGTALEKFQAYEESVEAKTQALTAAVEGLVNNFTSSDFVKAGLDIAKVLVNLADDTHLLTVAFIALAGTGIKTAGAKLLSFLTQAATGAQNFYSASSLITNGFVKQIDDFKNWGISLGALNKKQLQQILLTMQQTGALEDLSAADLKVILTNHGVEESLAETLSGWIANTSGATLYDGSLKVLIKDLIKYKMAQAQALVTNPYFLAISAIAAVIIGLVKWKKHQEEIIEQAHEIAEAYKNTQKELQAHKQSLTSTVSEFQSLSSGVKFGANTITNLSLTSDEYQRFLDISNELANEFPELVQGWDDQGNAILNYNKVLSETIKLQEQKIAKDREDYMYSRGAYKDSGYKEQIKGYQAEMKEKSYSLAEGFNNYYFSLITESTKNLFSDSTIKAIEQMSARHTTIASTSDAAAELIKYKNAIIQDLQEQGIDTTTLEVVIGDLEASQEALNNLSQQISEAVTIKLQTDSSTKNQFGELQTGLIDDFQKGIAVIANDTSKTTNQIEKESASLLNSFLKIQGSIPTQAIEELQTALQSGDKTQEEYNAELQQLIATTLALANGDENLLAVLINLTDGWANYGVQVNGVNAETEEQYGKVADLTDQLKEAAQAIDTVKSAQDEYNESGYISINTLEDLLKLDDEHLASLIDENGQLSLNTQGSYALLEAKLALAEATALEALNTAVANDASAKTSQVYSILSNAALDATQKVSALNAALAGGIIDTSGWSTGTQAALASYQLVEDTLAKVRSGTYSGGYKAPKSSSKSGSSSSKDPWLEAYKAELAELDHLKKMDKINTKEYYDELSRLTKKYFTGRDKYHENERENLEKLWDLYKQILDEEKERYENALKYVDDVIDKKIEELEKEKKALEDKNKATEDEIKLEQLQANLRKAQQRTMRVYYEDVGKMSADNKGDYIG